jgi:DNA-binding response OmpR family regulator
MSFDFFKRFVSTPRPQGEVSERRQGARVRAPLGSQVLVVDDSPTIRAVLGKMLVQDGYIVLKAPDGETAITMARSELPDLVFLDIVLPGMSGFEVLRTLRRDPHTRATPIVMISGNMQATEQFYVQRFGADDFMKKPFGRAEVFERIQMLVQDGRLPGRPLEAGPVIPAGISVEEWDAIPDVAMPDAQIGDAVVRDLSTDEHMDKV